MSDEEKFLLEQIEDGSVTLDSEGKVMIIPLGDFSFYTAPLDNENIIHITQEEYILLLQNKMRINDAMDGVISTVKEEEKE